MFLKLPTIEKMYVNMWTSKNEVAFFLKLGYCKESWPTCFSSVSSPAFHTWSLEQKKPHTAWCPWLLQFFWRWYSEEGSRDHAAALHRSKPKHSGVHTNNLSEPPWDPSSIHSLIDASPLKPCSDFNVFHSFYKDSKLKKHIIFLCLSWKLHF